MMWVLVWRKDAIFYARMFGCSAGSPQSPSPPGPATYPSSVTPICKTTRLIRTPFGVSIVLSSADRPDVGIRLHDIRRARITPIRRLRSVPIGARSYVAHKTEHTVAVAAASPYQDRSAVATLAAQQSRPDDPIAPPADQASPAASPASNTRGHNLMAWMSTPGCCATSPPSPPKETSPARRMGCLCPS